jgi:thiol-disulfide isomerase/thioredoxin
VKKLLILFVGVLYNMGSIFSQGSNIAFKIGDYTNDTLIVGYYYGEKQLVKDTVYAKSPGNFVWKSKEAAEDGMYLALIKPENTYVQFLIDGGKQEFDIAFQKDNTGKVTFKNSNLNTDFYSYMDVLKEKGEKASKLRDQLKKDEEAKKDVTALKDEQSKLDAEVKKYQENFIKENDNYLGKLILSTKEIEIPTFTGMEDEVNLQRFLFYKKHYWDYTDWNMKSLIRTPYIHNKIDTYIKKLTSNQPDSVLISVKDILGRLKDNPDAEKYYLSHFLNEYANGKQIGMDKIFVWINDNYYAKGKTPWVTEDNLKKINESADKIRPILIGKVFPNITTYKQDNTPVVLHNIQSKYTLLVFWAPDCGHCKKSMPDIIKAAEDYKLQGLTTVTVCTKPGDKAATCWEGVKEKGMESLINTGDEYQRYRQIVDVPSTPKLFLLDNKKEIILKDFGAENLQELMKEVIKVDEEKLKKSEVK